MLPNFDRGTPDPNNIIFFSSWENFLALHWDPRQGCLALTGNIWKMHRWPSGSPFADEDGMDKEGAPSASLEGGQRLHETREERVVYERWTVLSIKGSGENPYQRWRLSRSPCVKSFMKNQYLVLNGCSFRVSLTPGTLSSDSTHGPRRQITSKLLLKNAVNSSDRVQFGEASN